MHRRMLPILILAATLAGCGGGGGGGGDTAAAPAAPAAPAAQAPAAPAPADQQLRAQMAQDGVTALTPVTADPARVRLGQALMFDKILSGNRDVACATCHHPTFRTGDGSSLSIGTGGTGLGPARTQGTGQNGQGLLDFTPRNAPDLFDRGQAAFRTMFWDSRVSRNNAGALTTPAGNALPAGLSGVLAAQALFPVTSRLEMRGNVGDADNELAALADDDFAGIWAGLVARLTAIQEYRDLFAAAFPGEQPGIQHVANAIADFQAASFQATNSPFDRYLRGDDSALTDQQKRGAGLFFGRARCSNCHNGPLLTDQQTHVVAVPQIGPGSGDEAPQDFGREGVTGDANDRYEFRTPPLRNVALSAPYFHDGAFTTLTAAVVHYRNPAASLQNYNPAQLDFRLRGTFLGDPAIVNALVARLDPQLQAPINLNNQDVADLVAFLESMTDPDSLDLSDTIPLRVPSGLPVDR